MSLANRVEGLSINKSEGQGMGPPFQRRNGHHHMLQHGVTIPSSLLVLTQTSQQSREGRTMLPALHGEKTQAQRSCETVPPLVGSAASNPTAQVGILPVFFQ